MKDLVHHLKHVQKKIISSSRKETTYNEIKNNPKNSEKISANNKKKIYKSK